MTNKTKSELERLRNNWKVATTLLTILILISWVCWVIDFSAWRGCENQLQECQDKVPVWNPSKTGNTFTFWENQTGEWIHHAKVDYGSWLEFYRNGIEIAIWDMTKEDIQRHKRAWCEVNEIENCEVIK